MSQGSKSAGHPVNVATGEMFSTNEDIAIPGKFPLTWKRRYSTRLQQDGHMPLGRGWTCPFFAQLTKVGGEYRFRTPDGGLDTFPDPKETVEHGGTVRNLGTFSEIGKQGFYLRITRWNPDSGTLLRFLFKAGRNGQAWPLLFLEQPDGQGLEFAWGENGLLKAVRQKLEKRMLSFSYTSEGRLAEVAYPHPELGKPVLARYEYDAKGRLAAAYDALGFADRYEYDREDRIVREIAKDGGVFTFKYDDKGRCIRTSGLGGYDLKILRYLDSTQWTEVVNSYGHVTRYHWNVMGQIMEELRPGGGLLKTEFDEHGRIVGKVDALGGERRFAFDEAGNRSSNKDPLGRETLEFFNANHQPIKQITPAGNEFKREYDAAGRLAKTIDPMGAEWKFHYDPDGNVVEAEMGTRSVKWTYGPKGELQATRDPEGHLTHFRSDAFGRIVERRGPMGDVWRTRYDLMGRPVEVIRADGARILNVRDAGGNVVEIRDADGGIARSVYGFCRRLLAFTDTLGNTTRVEWGTEPKRLMAIRNAKGEEYRFAYDADGNRVSARDFAGREKKLKYNAAGNVVSATNAMGEKITYLRDAVNRLIGIELSDGSALAFGYDESDYLLSASGPDGSLAFKRDALGRTLREEGSGFWIEYAYDADGRPIRKATSLGLEIGYGLDARGYLSEIGIDGAPFLSMTRNAAGAEILRTLPGPFRLEQNVDPSGRLHRQQVFPGPPGSTVFGKPVIDREYAWKGMVVTGIRDHWGTASFVYDQKEQLIQATRTGIPTVDFAYDAAGNLVSSNSFGTVGDMEIGRGDMLLRQGGTHYRYDAQGRLIRKSLAPDFPGGPAPAWEYAWDPLDQLRSITAPDGSRWEYGYDPLGRRIFKRGPEGETRFRWDRETVLHEERGDAPLTSWIFDIHTYKPLGARRAGKLFPVLTDHLGTPREMLDEEGAITWSADFGPWGDLREEKGGDFKCPIRFQGQWHDAESGLHYNRWRYYDPAMRRYITPDPIGLRGGLNAYRYCPNPINWIDPSGLDWNYVLVDGDNKPYYSGVSTQDPKQVESRHADNIGNDGQPRFNPAKGDRLIPITPIDKTSDNHDTARGLEQRVAEDAKEGGTVIGRQDTNGGSVRGNNQNPVSPDADNAEDRAKLAQKYLDEQGKTVKELIEDGIKKKDEEEENEGCKG